MNDSLSRRRLRLLLGFIVALPTASCLRSAVAAEAAPQIEIEAPTSGWRNSSIDPDLQNFQQEVHYPASDVNTPEGQSRLALIAGAVRGAAKTDQPYTLVVDGVAMPLKLDERGRYARPYVFGRGANTVEVRSPDGAAAAHAQFYEAQTDKLTAKLRVVLAWDTDASDLDLHVITPDGQHCWYGERTLSNGGALDVDVTNGYGPEIFATPVGLEGAYYVYVNYYGGSGTEADGAGPAPITIATVSVITDENTVDEKRQTFRVPMRRAGELLEAATFVYVPR